VKRAKPKQRVGNRLTRTERLARWEAAYKAGTLHEPQRLTAGGVLTPKQVKRARYLWLDWMCHFSKLEPTTRLVAHTLVLHGLDDGTRIFPGVREIADESGLSERSVSTHIDILCRTGWLQRKERERTRLWACGFLYILTAPRAVYEAAKNHDGPKGNTRTSEVPGPELTERPSAPQSIPPAERPSARTAERPSARTAERPSAPVNGSSPKHPEGPSKGLETGPRVEAGADVLNVATSGVEPDAQRVERGDIHVLKDVQRRFPSEVPNIGSHVGSHVRAASRRAREPNSEIEFTDEEKQQAIASLLRERRFSHADILVMTRRFRTTPEDIQRVADQFPREAPRFQ
jgi:DNA-binding MarR family transcriptional regulator